MPVTLDQKARAKAVRKTQGADAEPDWGNFDTYRLPKDKQTSQAALATWIGLLVLICAPWWLFESTLPFAYGMPAWCVISILCTFLIGPGQMENRLKKVGKSAVISTTTQPGLKGLLGKASKILGIKEPEGYIEKDEKPRVRTLPASIVMHEGTLKNLEPSEVSTLFVRALVHQREGHARRLFLIDLIELTQPKTVLLLIWPMTLYAKLLRTMWLPHAEQNTDRLAMFLVKNPNLMMSAILKEYAANDFNMQRLEVAPVDVTNWVAQRGHIGMAGEEISTQYKLGRAIHEAPILEERLQALQNWAKSKEFVAAQEKVRMK